MQNLKTHKKEKKTLFVNTLVLTALVKCPFFSSFFMLGFSVGISNFSRDVFDRSPNSKITKYQSNNNKNNNNKKTRCKAKKYNIVTQNKTREQAETQQQNNISRQTSNRTKQKARTRNWNEKQRFTFVNKPKTLEYAGKTVIFIRNTKKQTLRNKNKHKQNKPKKNKTRTTPRPLQETQGTKQKQAKKRQQEKNKT